MSERAVILHVMSTENDSAQPAHFRAIAPGVEMCLLRRHGDRGTTFMIRMAKGAHAPLHDHPGGEETFMIHGRLRISHRRDSQAASLPDAVVDPGEYNWAPPGERHDGVAEEACLFFVVAPGGVTKLEAA